MRVIAGSAKGIQLQAVPGSGTRPITDRVKESLYNILGDSIVDARVLDLFAGTGSVGIEALSRGAEQAVFVEKSPRAISTIQTNLRRTQLQPRARIVRADVFKFLTRQPQPFDLIYIAPPQYKGLWSRALQMLDVCPGWVDTDGSVIVQVFPKEWEPIPLTAFSLADQRKYGSTFLGFYRLKGELEQDDSHLA